MPDRFRASRRTLTAIALLVLLGQAVPAISQEAPRAAGPPYRVGGDVSRPELISSTKPVYTELARKSRVSGTVIVEAVIDEQGDITDARVLKGLPMGLDQAALDAIKTWKFKPATREGHPVSVYYVLTVNFQVDDSPFGYGPTFTKFLAQNPEFAAHLRAKEYQEAAELLDRWDAERPADPAIPLARIYLLLEQGQLQEAWQKALDDHGPERYESLCGVGAFALNQASKGPEGRAETIELGLQAETAAMAAQPDGVEAIRYKFFLLHSKAELTSDPAERQQLNEEADRLRKQGAELQKARAAGTAPESRQDRQ
jgi:TonB family protein